MIEAPQSFVVREECEKAAWQNGFRRPFEGAYGWAGFSSTTVPGAIQLGAAGPQGPWYLALDHAGVIEELALPSLELPGPGLSRHAFERLSDLYAALSHVYRLSSSLPDAPLRVFVETVRMLPQTTEVERLVVQRIGQAIFRDSLMDYWQRRCPLTRISDAALLRASHIVPWKSCDSDSQRLDVHNGLLLSALWDAAFDRGLVTFMDDGSPVFSPALSDAARAELRWCGKLPLTQQQRANVAWHRVNIFQSSAPGDAANNYSC